MQAVLRKRVTLKDIATRLGVSKSTVAKVLGNQPGSRVSERVAQKVRNTAKEMGYQPNHVAQALRTGKTSLVGLVIPRLSITAYTGFFHDMYMGVLEEINRSDYAVVQFLAQPRKKLENIIKRRLLDGIMIITSDPDNSDVDFLADTGLPLVVINREVTHRDVCFVTHEYEQAARKVVQDLVQIGHRRLALLALGNQNDSNQRLIKGFQEQVRSFGSQGVSGTWFDISVNTEEGYYDTARQVVENGPFDAYVVDIARQAEILVQVIKEGNGYLIGRNRDLIVFTPEKKAFISEATPWQLYQHRNEYMGQQACNLLYNQIDGDEKQIQRCFVPFEVITRT